MAHTALEDDLAAACRSCLSAVRAQLEGAPDLVFAFVSPALDDETARTLAEAFPDAHVLGCAAGGVVGGDTEVEGRSAVSLTAARLPGTHIEIQAFGPELAAQLEARHLRAALAPGDRDPSLVVALLDPKVGAPDELLHALDEAFPRAVKVGGLSSGPMHRPGLLVDGRASGAGGVLIALEGGLSAEAVVAQGCRPIGEPMLLTQVRNNLALELGQKAPLEVMRELHARLDERDQALFHHSLFLGIEMRDQLEYAGGDFLIRNVLGIEPKSGGLVVGARLEPWKAVQFHLRDGEASAADLAARLDRAKEAISAPPAAALLFSCLGRGEGLYGIPHHDTRLIRARFDGVPVGGFFCNGEIGPVGGDTFLHGYTSAIALISPA